MNNRFEVTFLGTGGSCTHINGGRPKYGGNTPCVAVRAGEETLIFDAGSGICGFGGLDRYPKNDLHIFFSHYHMDHINGLLFFSPLFDAQNRIELYGGGNAKSDAYGIIDSILSPPLNPVGIDALKAKCGFHTLDSGATLMLPGGAVVRTYRLSHPGGSMGYRVEYGGKSLCYCTDIELGRHQDDAVLLDFMDNADLLIIDSFFDDGKVIADWGHSSWREAAEWAKRAKAEKLALFHYDFKIFDEDIDIMEKSAQIIFPGAFASADYMRVEL